MAGDKLPTGTLIRFSALAAPMQTLLAPVTMVIPAFYAKNTAISLAAVGSVYLFSRFFDGVTDPLVGYLSDRTESRLGRRKPWLIAGALIAMVAVLYMFNPPADADWPYLFLCVIGMYVGYTMMDISHRSWGVELSHDYVERSRISTYIAVMTMIGFFAFLAIPLLPFFESSEMTAEVFTVISIGIVVLLPALVLLAVFTVPDGKRIATEKPSLHKLVLALKGNKPLLSFALAMISSGLGWGVFIAIAFLVIDTYLGLGAKFSIVMLLYAATRFAGLPLWLRLIKRFGKHRSWAVSRALEAVTVLSILLLPQGEAAFVPFLILISAMGIAGGANEVAPMAILGDVVDYDTLKTGANQSGNYFAFYSLIQKINYGIGGGVAFLILAAFGYDPKLAENTDLANFGLLATFAIVPALCYFMCAVFIWKFPIDARRQEIIRRRIEQRAERAVLAMPEKTG
jgi:GPH family glycoside/pentoside/hexuronide:cation symporter